MLYNVIEIAIWHGCFPCKFAVYFQSIFHKNTYGGFLLNEVASNLYQKNFISNNIVNKIKCMCWFSYISNFYKSSNFYKEKQVNVNFNHNEVTSCCINGNQYIQNKIKNKLHVKAIKFACFILGEKLLEVLKRIKTGFFNMKGDKFAMSVIWRKLTINIKNF